MAYAEIEPFGEERADLRAGIVASSVYNAMRGPGTRAYKPQDFMPNFDKPIGQAQPMSAVQMEANLKRFFGGKVKYKPKGS